MTFPKGLDRWKWNIREATSNNISCCKTPQPTCHTLVLPIQFFQGLDEKKQQGSAAEKLRTLLEGRFWKRVLLSQCHQNCQNGTLFKRETVGEASTVKWVLQASSHCRMIVIAPRRRTVWSKKRNMTPELPGCNICNGVQFKLIITVRDIVALMHFFNDDGFTMSYSILPLTSSPLRTSNTTSTRSWPSWWESEGHESQGLSRSRVTVVFDFWDVFLEPLLLSHVTCKTSIFWYGL